VATPLVADVISSSPAIKLTHTSIIDPTGATIVQRLDSEAMCQNEANDWEGGEHRIWAGVATETVVSLTSRFGLLEVPIQSTEHVAVDP